MGTLEITVDSGERGPVIRLNGEADLSTARELSGVLTAQISGGARHLTVELSQLRFADSATVRTLVEAYHMLGDRGGTLELAGPQPAVARTLSLLGMDQVLHVGPSVGTMREADRADRADRHAGPGRLVTGG